MGDSLSIYFLEHSYYYKKPFKISTFSKQWFTGSLYTLHKNQHLFRCRICHAVIVFRIIGIRGSMNFWCVICKLGFHGKLCRTESLLYAVLFRILATFGSIIGPCDGQTDIMIWLANANTFSTLSSQLIVPSFLPCK